MPILPLIFLLWAGGCLGVVSAAHADETLDSLLNLSISRLMDTEITIASKKKQRLATVASSVYVITQEDIRRLGAVTVPDALRAVPGLHVAQIDSGFWAIGARGFNDQFSNQLLVLVDGRTVYSPLFSGAFWDELDMVMEDIERIEVIRGPGAAVWGANAVNVHSFPTRALPI